jgi:hypothetical protein
LDFLQKGVKKTKSAFSSGEERLCTRLAWIGRNFLFTNLFRAFQFAGYRIKKIIGTDSLRGMAGVEPITAEMALKLGRAAAYVFARLNPRCWIFWKIAELPCYNRVA